MYYPNLTERISLRVLTSLRFDFSKIENRLITCDDCINALDVFEQGVIALLYDTSDEYYVYADTLMFIDKTGNILWEYSYPEDSISTYEIKTFISDSILFIFRGEGFIDVFNVKTGELLWEAEVRGHERRRSTGYSTKYLQPCRL
jgi:outer membrane protein assembly factor BamB